jgi:hypothetical protein
MVNALLHGSIIAAIPVAKSNTRLELLNFPQAYDINAGTMPYPKLALNICNNNMEILSVINC